jgi:cation diffusion facilitator CzcD-associated flavoprotein CzcO
MEPVPYSEKGEVKVDWWKEEFDAVVVAPGEGFDSAWVPPIEGLDVLAHAFPEQMYHSRDYRRPEEMAGKVNLRERPGHIRLTDTLLAICCRTS